jgi:hypothetical protein
MAKLSIASKSLKSRKIRTKGVGNNGTRKFRAGGLKNVGTSAPDGILGFFSSANNFLNSFLKNNVDTLLSGVSITFSSIWQGIISVTQFAYNFNWNITDQELDENVKQGFNALGNDFGRFAGFTAGYLACGALPGAVVMYFNKSLGMQILEDVGLAALDRLTGELSSIMTSITNYLASAALSYLYKNTRNFIRGTDLEFRTKLLEQGVPIKEMEKQANERNKPFVIAEKVETKVGTIKNEFLKNFVSSFIEEMGESCIEAGFVVTGRMDEHFSQQKLSRNPLLGVEKTIEITFDDNDKPVFNKQAKTVDYIDDNAGNK